MTPFIYLRQDVAMLYRPDNLYATWYEFKKDLEKQLGHNILNRCWLEVKPKAPLPWDSSQMQTAVSVLAPLAGRQAAPSLTRSR